MKNGVIGVIVAASTVTLGAQGLTDVQVQAAIKVGHEKKISALTTECRATPALGETVAARNGSGVQRDQAFEVVVVGNAGRIASMAADAKRTDKPFSAADVPPAMKEEPALFVTVIPLEPRPGFASGSVSVASPIYRVVLKSKGNPDVTVMPRVFQTEPVTWSNLPGGAVTANRATAQFVLGQVASLSDFDVTVITQHGERRCNIAAKDRTKLFPPT
jgi:hypothetical protein